MPSTSRDFRYGIRMLHKGRGFTISSILALALGIGSTTAIFSVMDAVLLHPLSFPGWHELVYISGRTPEFSNIPASGPQFTDWRQNNRVFSDIAAYANYQSFNLTEATETLRLKGAAVSANFFHLLQINPEQGRWFLPEEEQPGKGRAAILSYAFWQHHLAGAPVVGRELILNSQPFVVVGVLKKDFSYPAMDEDVWVPLNPDPANIGAEEFTNPQSHWLKVVARLKPGMNLHDAGAHLESIDMARKYTAGEERFSVDVIPLQEIVAGDSRRAVWVFAAAMGLVFLIACANVANLLLARATTRRMEMAVRMATGANRPALIRQLMVELLPLTALAALGGVALAYLALHVLSVLEPAGIPHSATINPTTLAFTTAVSLLAIVVFGLVPAVQTSNPNLIQSLRSGARTATLETRVAQSRLVTVEVGLALLLLVGSLTLLRSFFKLLNTNPSVDGASVMTARVELPPSYSSDPRVIAFFTQYMERVAQIPGAQQVGAIDFLPYAGLHNSGPFEIEGTTNTRGKTTEFRVVGGGYFRAMGIPLLAGRTFTAQDSPASLPVAMISRSMATRYFGGVNPIGRHVRFEGLPGTELQVIGIVADVKHWKVDEEAPTYIYVPLQQVATNSMYLVVRGARGGPALVPAMMAELRALDKNVALFDVSAMSDRITRSYASNAFAVTLLSIMAIIALVLSAVGIYGVSANSIIQRTHELGVRIALGASPGGVFRLVALETTRQLTIGASLGLLAAAVLLRLLTRAGYNNTNFDPLMFACAFAGCLTVGILAGTVPALRAARTQPCEALRDE